MGITLFMVKSLDCCEAYIDAPPIISSPDNAPEAVLIASIICTLLMIVNCLFVPIWALTSDVESWNGIRERMKD